MILYAATTNAGKLREFDLISGHFGLGKVLIRAVPGLSAIAAPEETGSTFEENAILKAEYYSRFVDGFVFADDSGLAVAALDGAPGIYSARYAGPEATDAANNEKVLAEMSSHPDRSASFVCAIAVAAAGKVERTFHGQVDGQLLHGPKGPNGFGYDPLFYFPPFGCTFGEASAEQKMLVSHRGKAMQQMIDWATVGL